MKLQLSDITRHNFDKIALDVFRYQASNNEVYKEYLAHIKCDVAKVNAVTQIPMLPISFFKTHRVVSGDIPIIQEFRSSGTGNEPRSKHYVADVDLYLESCKLSFERFYGKIEDYCIVALLPSYQENPHSSLIYMVDYFIKESRFKQSCYALENQNLSMSLQSLKMQKIPTLVIGVTHALLDWAETNVAKFPELTIMETGGMKGRRKEMIRTEVHEIIKKSTGVSMVHSEYGMSELLSQAYSKGDGIFRSPDWMCMTSRPINEPYGQSRAGETGVLNVIDLANVHSCSFIETQDLAKVYQDGSFEILGRLDFSDLRGCNLLVQ